MITLNVKEFAVPVQEIALEQFKYNQIMEAQIVLAIRPKLMKAAPSWTSHVQVHIKIFIFCKLKSNYKLHYIVNCESHYRAL